MSSETINMNPPSLKLCIDIALFFSHIYCQHPTYFNEYSPDYGNIQSFTKYEYTQPPPPRSLRKDPAIRRFNIIFVSMNYKPKYSSNVNKNG
jgi:hypothetical protein